MSLEAGQSLELTIEKPAAGGRMIARHDRLVVLVQGAIPGERVVARVERVEKQVAFAGTVRLIEPSVDRRGTVAAPHEAACGGCLYAHISYPRQVSLKAEVIRDAFTRLGRIPIDSIDVAHSPDHAYRMRARLHVRGEQFGFYREGTHDLCDASTTGQLTAGALEAARRIVGSLSRSGHRLSAIELAENIAADERVFHITLGSGSVTDAELDEARGAAGLTGCTVLTLEGVVRTSGVPVVTDPLAVLTSGRAGGGVLQRHAASFFQANRFLLPQLVTSVLDAVSADGPVIDLYAGVGLFSVSLAASGREGVTAVEGDRTSAADLQRNSAANGSAVGIFIDSVERYLTKRKGPAARTLVVDPPRTGISREAMKALLQHGAGRIVYVSCDPATMARDARRLLDGGYRLSSLRGFDLFPNTPHVELLGVFDR
jgi:23S rRNA (uracil1939-C5)-methyltransferase